MGEGDGGDGDGEGDGGDGDGEGDGGDGDMEGDVYGRWWETEIAERR